MAKADGTRIDLDGVSHRFGAVAAARDIRLSIAGAEMIALLGPSGCGKSTLLRIIAGFIQQSAGRVLFDGTAVDELKPAARGVGIVFQNYALFPHMTVAQNVAYGLEAQRWRRADIGPRVAAMLDLVQMASFAERYPKQLSGGQQQRIALARCLATGPKVLLLDEPFGALDKNLRLDMQIEVKRLQRATGITTILVTHDQEEALSMADRIAVMNKGAIEQVAAPTEIYDRPSSLFVNQFVGAANLFAAEVVGADPAVSHVRLASGVVLSGVPAEGLAIGAPVWLAIRPENLAMNANGTSASGLSGKVKTVLPLGSQVAYDVEVAGGLSCRTLAARRADEDVLAPGADVIITPVAATVGRIYPR